MTIRPSVRLSVCRQLRASAAWRCLAPAVTTSDVALRPSVYQ